MEPLFAYITLYHSATSGLPTVAVNAEHMLCNDGWGFILPLDLLWFFWEQADHLLSKDCLK